MQLLRLDSVSLGVGDRMPVKLVIVFIKILRKQKRRGLLVHDKVVVTQNPGDGVKRALLSHTSQAITYRKIRSAPNAIKGTASTQCIQPQTISLSQIAGK
jgi:hypothetical protein